jgi:hypothetical protein
VGADTATDHLLTTKHELELKRTDIKQL